jgi:hypothetical protein
MQLEVLVVAEATIVSWCVLRGRNDERSAPKPLLYLR